MESPFEKIAIQKQNAPGVIKVETGILFYKRKEVMEWLCIEYKSHYEIYLLLDDFNEPPYRNYLTSGVGRTLEQARNRAVKNMEKEMFSKKYKAPTH